MHELLHVAILVVTVLGAGGLALLVVWRPLFDRPLPPGTRRGLIALTGLALALLLVEWRVVH